MTHQQRWQARTWLAWFTRAVVFLLPIIAAVAAAWFAASRLPEPTTPSAMAGWWAIVVGGSLAASYVVDRVARRLLPLAALLNLSLVFPDQAPSRFKIALRTWSTGRMRREVLAARDEGSDDDPTRAAEFALGLVASLANHDRLTRGHAERTRAYTDLLAEELKLDLAERDRLRWAALLHDIGKVRVAAEILNKEGRLEDREWSELQQHPRHGFELIGPIREFLGPWAETVLHHHERYDGTGYPQGLSGKEIALGARIVSVADAYDAMTAARTYQQPLSRKAALAELAASAGGQFDPTVVRAFLSISVGAVRRVAGPLVVLAQIPFIGGIRRVIDGAGVVTAAGIGIIGTIGLGAVPDGVPDPIPAVVRPADVVEAPQASPGSTQAGMSLDNDGFEPQSTTTSEAVTTTAPTTPTSSLPPTTSTTTPASTTSTLPPTTSTTTPSTPPSSTTTTSAPPPTTSTTTTSTTLPPNQDPVVADDAATTREDEPATFDVLVNDWDPEQRLDAGSLRILEVPNLGSATVAGETVRYVPETNRFGSDTLRYEVCDLDGGCGQATVAVTVVPVNDNPSAEPDAAIGFLISDTVIDVLANDHDVDGDAVVIAAFDGTSALGGSVTCALACTYHPPEEWFVADTFTYVVADGNGGQGFGTVTVSPPVLPVPLLPWRAAVATPVERPI